MLVESHLLNIIDTGIILLNDKNEIVHWNDWMERYSQIPREDALRKNIFVLFPNMESSKFERCVRQSLHQKHSFILSDTLNKNEVIELYTDNTRLTPLRQKTLIHSITPKESEVFCFIQILNQTKMRKKENLLLNQTNVVKKQNKDLSEAKKLGELAEMTGGIVHEINNPITIVRSCAQQLRELEVCEKSDEQRITPIANKVEEMTYRVQKIISGLKVIAHKEQQKFEDHISIQNIIKESISLSREKISNHNVEVKVSEFPEDWKIWCDRVQISQIFINLLNNAIDEINDKYENPWVNFSVREKDQFYEICVTDCGLGIPKKVQRNIFTAFITTKKVGKGTGLGLSISKNIANLHKGDLYIDNKMENTTFVAKFYKDIIWEEVSEETAA